MLSATATATATATTASTSGSIEGLWQAKVDHAEVRMERCGEKICGRLITSDRLKAFPDQRDVHNHDRALRDRPLKGVLIVQGFSGGPQEATGGTVYDPAGGGVYAGKISLTGPDRLKLTGCIVAPLCRSQIWTRIGSN